MTVRERRDCQHPQSHHEHGTYAAYVKDRCRCPDCTAACAAQSQTLRDRARTQPRQGLQGPGAEREAHARRLLEAGHSPGQVAMASGLTLAAVDRLAGLPTTAERITGTAPSDGQYGAGWVVSYPERPDEAQRCGWGLGCTGPVVAGGMCAAHEGARPAKGPLPLFALGGRKRRAA